VRETHGVAVVNFRTLLSLTGTLINAEAGALVHWCPAEDDVDDSRFETQVCEAPDSETELFGEFREVVKGG